MSVLFVALPVALLLGFLGLVACIYCIRGDQYEDLESPPCRILIDDKPMVALPQEHSDASQA